MCFAQVHVLILITHLWEVCGCFAVHGSKMSDVIWNILHAFFILCSLQSHVWCAWRTENFLCFISVHLEECDLLLKLPQYLKSVANQIGRVSGKWKTVAKTYAAKYANCIPLCYVHPTYPARIKCRSVCVTPIVSFHRPHAKSRRSVFLSSLDFNVVVYRPCVRKRAEEKLNMMRMKTRGNCVYFSQRHSSTNWLR